LGEVCPVLPIGGKVVQNLINVGLVAAEQFGKSYSVRAKFSLAA
jgi:hypothetical protein